MRYLKGEEAKIAEFCTIGIASVAAVRSTCKKSQRGAVIVKDGNIIGRGHNKVTIEEYCNPCVREDIKDNSRVELCPALHAEQVAILDALKNDNDLEGSILYHIKMKDGEIKPSDDVSCTVCSRLILESGISGVVLLHKNGFALYDSEEFNRKSFEYFMKR